MLEALQRLRYVLQLAGFCVERFATTDHSTSRNPEWLGIRTGCPSATASNGISSTGHGSTRDDGRTWQGTLIDSGMWAMGTMCEVEPDVVLYVYMDTFEGLMRRQLIRVTPTGLESGDRFSYKA